MMIRNLCLGLLKFSLLVSLADAKILDSAGTLPASALLLRRLAEHVCSDVQDFMFPDQDSADACPENFNTVESERGEEGDGGEAVVRCRWSSTSLTLQVTPSARWQLVVLLPDLEEEPTLSYSLIWPKSTTSEIDVLSPSRNYTLYSTTIQHGRAGYWRRHDSVLAWNEYQAQLPEHKEYNVQILFVNYTKDDKKVTGIVTWKHTDDADACFTFTNYCNKLIAVDVGPEKSRRVVVPGLPMNHSCRAEVTGLYGTTEVEYRTPVRDPSADNDPGASSDDPLQVPRVVYMEAVPAGGAGWDVRVAWAPPPPARTPDRYTLVLRADAEHTLNLTGNATEAMIAGVRGAGVYNVSLYAYRGRYRAHTFKRALFMASSSEWRWVGAAGGAWVAAALCLVGLALCWLRLRVRREHDDKPKGTESKPLEEALVALREAECEDQWEVRRERLLLHEVVGEGAFGKVRRAVLAPQGKEVAVKMLKDFPTADEVRAFRLEMEVMKSVGVHGHVVSLLGCCSGARPLIVQEYCARGDLLSFLRRSWDVMMSRRNAKYYNNNIETEYRNEVLGSKPATRPARLAVNKMYELQGLCGADLTPRDLLSFCRQIAKGMDFLAANRLVHRDLAARNVLVTSDRTLKIADFGLSRDVYEENQYRQKGNGKMPVKWMAPESLARRIYTSQSDVWSFGVVVWEVVTVGCAPYPAVPAARLPRLLRAGYRMPRPINCTKQLYEVMLSCWEAAPRARPTFSALVRRLDELLQAAAAGDYLALDLDPPPAPASASLHPALTYFKMIMRGKRAWTREAYERPLRAPQGTRNHYTSAPAPAQPPA